MIARVPFSAKRSGSIDWHIVVLIGLLLGEGAVFYPHVATQIAPFYPRSFDQVSYLVDSYRFGDSMRSEGVLGRILREYLYPPSPAGESFIVQGGLISHFFGYHRIAMLSINFIYFSILQLVLFHSIRARTGYPGLSWMGVAFLISSQTIFSDPGGAYDFRIDFCALCLYGIWTCMFLASGAGYSRIKMFLVAGVGIWLVTMRFFTILYIGAVYGGMFVVYILNFVFYPSPEGRIKSRRLACNVGAAGALTAAITIPLLYSARKVIYDYYVQGHLIGNDKEIWMKVVGLHSLGDHLLFYPRSIAEAHFGYPALCLMGLAVVLMILAAVSSTLTKRSMLSEFIQRVRANRDKMLILALAIIVPVILLTFDEVKSSVVGGIVVVPAILIVILVLRVFWPDGAVAARVGSAAAEVDFPSGRITLGRLQLRFVKRGFGVRALPGYIIVGVCAAALVLFVAHGTARSTSMSAEDLRRVVAMNDAIARYALDNNLRQPKLSVDRVVDCIYHGTVDIVVFENYRRRLDFEGLFGMGPYGIYATPRKVAMQLIEESDIVVLSDPALGREVPFPINTKIKEYWVDMAAWAERNRLLLYATEIGGVPYRVFVRPIDSLSATSNN
jgi:hypothetical protein